MLSEANASVLLEIARDAINHQIQNKDFSPSPREEKEFNERSGCFVTIKQNGRLRGCIGNFQAKQPLFREVAEMAAASASQDPRFPSMQAQDLNNFTLEITVLSPLMKISNIDQIQVGTHGIYIENGANHGVLLPQVATEYGWDKTNFLRQTCLKAGLPDDAWQHPDTEIYIFSGQVISEKK